MEYDQIKYLRKKEYMMKEESDASAVISCIVVEG